VSALARSVPLDAALPIVRPLSLTAPVRVPFLRLQKMSPVLRIVVVSSVNESSNGSGFGISSILESSVASAVVSVCL
jgi:hypothetical protein